MIQNLTLYSIFTLTRSPHIECTYCLWIVYCICTSCYILSVAGDLHSFYIKYVPLYVLQGDTIMRADILILINLILETVYIFHLIIFRGSVPEYFGIYLRNCWGKTFCLPTLGFCVGNKSNIYSQLHIHEI